MKMKWKMLILTFLCSLLFTVTVFADSSVSVTGGSEKSSAQTVSIGTEYAGTLTGGEIVWFKFTTPASKGYIDLYEKNISVPSRNWPSDADCRFYLMDVYEESICSSWLHKGDEATHNVSVGSSMTLEPSTTYYLKVYCSSDSTDSGYYKFSLTFTEDTVGDTADTATAISLGQTVTGTLDGETDVDYYSFTTGNWPSYTMTAQNVTIACNSSHATRFEIFSAIGESQKYVRLSQGSSSSEEVALSPNTTYYFAVSDPWSGMTGTYTFDISPVKYEISESTITYTSSYNYTGKAITPAVTVVYSGKTLTKGTDYTVSYSNNKNAGTATITITGIGDYTGTVEKNFTINKISQTITLGDVASKVAVGDTTTITASAKGKITYSSSDTSIAKVSSKGVVTGKLPGTVTITVKAAATTNYKSATKTVSIKVTKKTTTKPTVKRSSYNSLKITWTKFSGASGYYVYRSTKSGSGYKKIATITKGSTVTYTDKSRTTGKTYYYKIKAYKTVDGKKTVISTSKAGSGKATLAKPTVTLTAGSKKITVKISKKVSGASGYVIYRSTKKSSGYKAVKTVKSGNAFTWKNSSLKAKTTYYYKVRAYRTVNGKKVYSSYSTVVSKKTK